MTEAQNDGQLARENARLAAALDRANERAAQQGYEWRKEIDARICVDKERDRLAAENAELLSQRRLWEEREVQAGQQIDRLRAELEMAVGLLRQYLSSVPLPYAQWDSFAHQVDGALAYLDAKKGGST